MQVNTISAVGIIYRASDPTQIFLEKKTAGYPRKIFLAGLLIGGNWIGEKGASDRNPLETFRREIKEEITFEKPPSSFQEFNLIHSENHRGSYRVTGSEIWTPTFKDRDRLNNLKNEIIVSCQPFWDFVQRVPEEVFRRAEPDYNKGDYCGLCSVFQAGLSEGQWKILIDLQEKSGNLSNESQTVITSLSEIVSSGFRIGWCQDRMLQSFFLSRGFKEANDMPLIPGVEAIWVGRPKNSYENYLSIYDVAKRP